MSLYGLHRNLQHWGDPDNFRPERFLLDGKVVQVKVLFEEKKISFFVKFSRILGCFHFPLGSDAVSVNRWRGEKTRFREDFQLDFQGHRLPDVLTVSSAFYLATNVSTSASFFGECWGTYDWTERILGNNKTSDRVKFCETKRIYSKLCKKFNKLYQNIKFF